MRLARFLVLSASLLATGAFAEGAYQVELVLFRQAGQEAVDHPAAPDDWAAGALPPSPANQLPTRLDEAVARLQPAKGYRVLLHKAWKQGARVALDDGEQRLGHFPVEGNLELDDGRPIPARVRLWINRFDADGLLTASERFRQEVRLQPGELTYLDQGSLGLLIKVSPL